MSHPRILIIRFSSIGDIVLTTPVIRCLKLQLGAEVHFLTKKSFAGILEANPYLSQIHTIEKNTTEILPTLRKIPFDYIIDLHKNIRSLQVRLALSAPCFSFDKLNFKKWLLVNFKINRLPDIHIADRYLKAVQKPGVINDGKGLDYFIPSAVALPPAVGKLPDFIAFAIGAAHATKRLPNEKIIEICRKINRPVVLLGGLGDAENGRLIAESAGAHVLNMCGKISLHQSALTVLRSAAVITHDTGMMHIAAALRKRIISVWGSTVPDFGMYPYLPGEEERSTVIEVKNLSCRPCSKIGFGQCPQGHFKCMRKIDTQTIAECLGI